MHVEYTPRGFEIIKFKDRYGKHCSLQLSSAIGDYDDSLERPGSSYVWLGCDDTEANNARMHLSREDAIELAQRLENWAETGSFKYEEETEVL